MQKEVTALKKDNEALIKREKATTTMLEKIDSEIQTFQSEKQSKLNELDVVLTLKLHQIQYLSKDRFGMAPQTAGDGAEEDAPSLETAVVLTKEQLVTLAARIGELEEEKKALRKRQKDIKKENRRVGQMIKIKVAENEVWMGLARALCPLTACGAMFAYTDTTRLSAVRLRTVPGTPR